ncbi:MAG: ABC transporter permease [Vicinamibacterales bacterium]
MFWQDVRLAARLLVKDKWYTAVAVVALGLGIGVNSTIFTFVNAVLIRGLPYQDSHRLMYVSFTNPGGLGQSLMGMSYPDYEELRAESRTFDDLAAQRTGTMNVSDAERPAERVVGAYLTANTFGMLGQPPLLGRGFLPGEDTPGAQPVAILGYALWQNRYGGDPAVLGRTLRVNEVPARVVGVMPQGMKFPHNAEMWMPLVPDADARRRSTRALGVFGALRPGATREQAQAEMAALAHAIAQRHPETNKGVGAFVQSYNDRFNGGTTKVLFLSLMGAVALVLLIACANVANLLLARSAARAREVALRMAIGATRARVVRQLLVESLLVGCVAGLAGLALSFVGVRLFDEAVSRVQKPYWIVFTMDGTVFAFLAGVCLLTGILFGLAPALQVSGAHAVDLLKEGGRGGAGAARSRRLTSAMVVAEVALTIVLLVAAGLMVRSYLKIEALELGFDTTNLVGGAIQLTEARWNEPAARLRFQEQVIERVRALPGVKVATAASGFPLTGGAQMRVEIEGRPAIDRAQAPQTITVSIAGEYFPTLSVHLIRGRDFSSLDGRPGSEVAIVSERFAAQMFPGEDPIGRRFRFLTDTDRPWLTVVGVSPSIRQGNPQQPEPEPVVYQPFRQDPTRLVGLLVRTAMDPAGVVAGIRAAVREVNPDQPLYNVRTYEELLTEVAWMWRVFGTLFAIFAAIALVLSAIGLYAVTSYSVAQRTQEIGVRMALGARTSQVSWLILRRGLAQLGIGTGLGLAGAYFASSLLATLLVQMSPHDAVTFATITGLLLIVTVLACLLPAWKAMHVDPVIALRAE